MSATITAWGEAPNPNQPPSAAFQFNCNGTDCSFDASASTDSDGNIQSYQWNFGDGGSENGSNSSASHYYSQAGTYTVTLTVVDNGGASGSASSAITVVDGEEGPPPNEPPTASFTFSCNELACSFNGSSSSDADGNVVSYQWNFGDGGSSSGVSRSHTFGSSGTYQVTLTVRDDQDATDSKTRSVQVTAAPPPPAGEIALSGSGRKFKGSKEATLNWDGAGTSNVQIIRDGSSIAVTSNDGAYVDGTVSKRAKSATYKVCESGGSACSNTITVRF